MRDRRGMRRFVRLVLHTAAAHPGVTLELISQRRGDGAALRGEFGPLAVRRPPGRKERSYDVVWYPWNGVHFPTAIPSLVTIYDVFAFEEPPRELLARWREQGPLKRAARSAQKILTHSEWSRSRIALVLGVPPERVEVVLPMPDPFFTPGDAVGLPEALAGKRYVLFVATREQRKNARTLIAACARALRGRDEMLAIIGKLPAQDAKFAKAIGVPIREGAVNDEALRALYRNAGVVAVPSTAEAFGLVAVEALACGAPVLAANTSSLPEAVGDAAQLLDPLDIEAWAREIRRLLDDPIEVMRLRASGAARYAGVDRLEPARRTLRLLFETAAA